MTPAWQDTPTLEQVRASIAAYQALLPDGWLPTYVPWWCVGDGIVEVVQLTYDEEGEVCALDSGGLTRIGESGHRWQPVALPVLP